MKKTLFVASLLACALPVLAGDALTLSGEGISNSDSWNLYATFDKLEYTDTFTTLATINLSNPKNASADYAPIYAVGYTYSTNNTLTLCMTSWANPNSWVTLDMGTVTLSADNPVSFALSHNGKHKSGDDTMALRGATGNTTDNFKVSAAVNSAKADTYTGSYLTNVMLGTDSSYTRLSGNTGSVVLTPAASDSINIVSARLEHEPYTLTAFKEFVLEEKPFDDDEVVRYTTVEQGNQKNVYSYGTANGEVTFNPDKFDESGKLTLNKTIDLTARTTFIVDDGKTVEINGAEQFTGTDDKTHEKGSAFGSGELVKSGGGTLKIRLNDTNRDIATEVRNDYDGSVTVEEGTLFLTHSDVDVESSAYKARLGGGKDTVITIKEGATLEMGDRTEISIPLGAHTSKDPHAHNIVIDGGAVHVHRDDEYHIPETQLATSTIQNAVITREGVDQVDEEVRARLIVAGITVFDAREGDDMVVFKNADILTDDFYFNGHTVLRNTNLFADETLIASSLATDGLFSLDVLEGSHVIYGAGADAHSSGTWGHVDNVYVDKTSKLQTAENSLESHWSGCLHIQGQCKLDIADITLPDDQKGLAVRHDGTVQAVDQNGEILTLDDISYVTDQLSGDMLIKYDQVSGAHGTLDLHLKDPKEALLPDGKELTNTAFTLTLTNFDSSLLVVDAFGNLDPAVAKLTIDAFEDTQWHLVYGYYDKTTNNSIFTFSTMENLKLTPEPATATLSLLALAALAARRKRK